MGFLLVLNRIYCGDTKTKKLDYCIFSALLYVINGHFIKKQKLFILRTRLNVAKILGFLLGRCVGRFRFRFRLRLGCV